MWTLIVVFLSPYVGTATTAEFYSKKACQDAKAVIESSVESNKVIIKAACVYQGD